MSSIHDDVKKSFGLASLRREAMAKLNGKDWEDYRKIKTEIDLGRRFEKRDYQLTYKTRVEAERKRLIDQAGAKDRGFKPFWSRNDQFDAATTLRQADRNVRHDHQQRMARYDAHEIKASEALIARADARNALRDKPRQDFARAVDRRDGEERREQRRIRTRD